MEVFYANMLMSLVCLKLSFRLILLRKDIISFNDKRKLKQQLSRPSTINPDKCREMLQRSHQYQQEFMCTQIHVH